MADPRPFTPAIGQEFNSHVRLVVIAPALDAPGRFDARVNDDPMVISSRTPLVDVARELLARGADSNGWLVVRRAGSHDDERTKIGVAAGLGVEVRKPITLSEIMDANGGRRNTNTREPT